VSPGLATLRDYPKWYTTGVFLSRHSLTRSVHVALRHATCRPLLVILSTRLRHGLAAGRNSLDNLYQRLRLRV